MRESAAVTGGISESRWHLPPVRGLVTLLAGEGLSRVLSFAAIALLTRRLGAAAWAPIAVALTAAQFGTLLVEAGMRLFGAREVAKNPGQAARLMRPILSTQLVIASGLVLAAIGVAALRLVGPELGRLLPGYAVSLVALPFFFLWIFQGWGAMEWVAIPQVTRYAVFLGLSALVVTGPARIGWLPWLEVAAVSAGAATAALALGRRGVRISASWSSAFEGAVTREALPIAASSTLWVVRMYLPIVVLWALSSKESVSRFDVSLRVLMVIQAGLSMYLTNLYTPLSRAVEGPRRGFVGLLLGSSALATAGTLLLTLALSIRPGELLGFLNGAAFNTPESASALTLLAWVIPFLALRGHGIFALTALGRQRIELVCSVVASALLVVLLIRWVPVGGARAAAMAMLGSEAFGFLLTTIALGVALRRRSATSGEAPGVAWAPSSDR
jgi:O-antigen/teichoic acid export membrane protein